MGPGKNELGYGKRGNLEGVISHGQETVSKTSRLVATDSRRTRLALTALENVRKETAQKRDR